MLGDWDVSLFVEVLVGMDGGGGNMLRNGNGLCLDMLKLSFEKV